MSGIGRTVVVGGGSGFVGRQLCKYLDQLNYHVVVVGRARKNKSLFSLDDSSRNRSTTTWEEIKDCGLPDQTVGVVNLAGENVLNPLKRWNEEFRKSVFTSRIETTRVLAKAVSKAAVPPAAFVTMSGVGFYPPGNEPQDETRWRTRFHSQARRGLGGGGEASGWLRVEECQLEIRGGPGEEWGNDSTASPSLLLRLRGKDGEWRATFGMDPRQGSREAYHPLH